MTNLLIDQATVLIGQLIKSTRQAKHISQEELADGICSQSLISIIENGLEIPNVFLFYKICIKLEIEPTNNFLQEALDFEKDYLLGEKLFALCKKHEYVEMINYMESSETLNKIYSKKDFQVYYYYYACALYQTKRNLLEVERYLKLATVYTMKEPYNPKNKIEILLISALGVIAQDLGKFEKSFDLFKISYKSFLQCTDRNENLNVVAYQFGEFLYRQERYTESLSILLKGFNIIIKKSSFFMLAEYALLISKCYENIGNDQSAKRYYHNYETFLDIESL